MRNGFWIGCGRAESNQLNKPMKTKASPNAHRGSDFSDFLAGEGILPEVEVLALIRWIVSKSGTALRHRHCPPHEC